MKIRWSLLALSCVLAACSSINQVSRSDMAALSPLVGSEWHLSEANQGVLAENQEATHRITMGFDNERVFGNAGCNRYFATYTLKGDTLDLGNAGTTMMLCDEDSNRVERAFLTLLEKPLTLKQEKGRLTVAAPGGEILVFIPADDAAKTP